MNCIIDHCNALLPKCLQSCTKTGKSVCDTGVVLDIGITLKILRCLLRMRALHYINKEVLEQLTVSLCLINIIKAVISVDLSVS